ncbi:VanZ family protein [Candidatus Woesebacteria bacterium]|nr:VanZ family protein [Candidatus Woesebacteria bacterium]
MKKLNRLCTHWLNAYAPPLIWAAVIFFLSSQSALPSFSENIADFFFKKTAHVVTYLVLYILLFRGYKITHPHIKNEYRWIFPLTLTFMYAVIDEIHQTFTPGRYGTLRDIGFDMVGVSLWFLRQYKYI